jgi:hypothetical protein
MTCTFDYGYTKVRDLCAAGERRRKSCKVNISAITVEGQEAVPTKRFWKSFFVRFGISDSVFRYFEPAEVFGRISERAPDDLLRYCLERQPEGPPRLLAVSHPSRDVIRYAEVLDLVSRYGGLDPKYADGIVTTTHTPRSGDQSFRIGGDHFQHRFVLETPVDGFSHPKIYLSLLRQICTNGMVGYTRAFRSDVSLGKDIAHCIGRALETYDNGEGYAALRQRFESAQSSWASVRECLQLYKSLIKVKERKDVTSETLMRDFYRMTGNLNELYGLANLDALSGKRQRVLPARCRVYDLLNFASEIATHHSTAEGARTMQACIGSLISDEYDLEGTAETVPEFADFFVPDGSAAARVLLN